jgi:DNA invertase Pin-like site-specific DNA recombinase
LRARSDLRKYLPETPGPQKQRKYMTDCGLGLVLGGLAEFERELIRARTGEGRRRAQDRGVKFGRPSKLTAHQRQEALARLANGETQADVARTYAVDPTTIGRLQAAP